MFCFAMLSMDALSVYYMHIYVFVNMYICMSVYICMCTCVNICLCLCVLVHTFICIKVTYLNVCVVDIYIATSWFGIVIWVVS